MIAKIVSTAITELCFKYTFFTWLSTAIMDDNYGDKKHIWKFHSILSPISAGHVGEPGPGDITILSNAFSSNK